METYTVLYIGCIIEEGSILNLTTFGVRIVLERKQEGSLCLRAVAPPEAPTARNELSWLSREDSGGRRCHDRSARRRFRERRGHLDD